MAGAQSEVGFSYTMGLGVGKDASKAIEWYTKAAEQNHAQALYNLGVFFINGEDVPKDINRGLEYLKKAASLGHEGAMKAFRIYQ